MHHVGLDTVDDAYLEMALLVASGYELAHVKKWMIRLVKKGKLKLAKREQETWRNSFASIHTCRMPVSA